MPLMHGGNMQVESFVTKNKSWKELSDSFDGKLKPYNAATNYYIGDAVEHDSFGVGFVTDSFGNEIDVLFKDGQHKLTHLVVL